MAFRTSGLSGFTDFGVLGLRGSRYRSTWRVGSSRTRMKAAGTNGLEAENLAGRRRTGTYGHSRSCGRTCRIVIGSSGFTAPKILSGLRSSQRGCRTWRVPVGKQDRGWNSGISGNRLQDGKQEQGREHDRTTGDAGDTARRNHFVHTWPTQRRAGDTQGEQHGDRLRLGLAEQQHQGIAGNWLATRP